MHRITIITVSEIEYQYDDSGEITGYEREADGTYGYLEIDRYKVDEYLADALSGGRWGDIQDKVPTLTDCVLDILHPSGCTEITVQYGNNGVYFMSRRFIEANASGTESVAHLEGFTGAEMQEILAAVSAEQSDDS